MKIKVQFDVSSQEAKDSAIERSRGTNLKFNIPGIDPGWTPIDHLASFEDTCCLCRNISKVARPLGNFKCSLSHLSHSDCFIEYAEYCRSNRMLLKCPSGCDTIFKNDLNATI